MLGDLGAVDPLTSLAFRDLRRLSCNTGGISFTEEDYRPTRGFENMTICPFSLLNTPENLFHMPSIGTQIDHSRSQYVPRG